MVEDAEVLEDALNEFIEFYSVLVVGARWMNMGFSSDAVDRKRECVRQCKVFRQMHLGPQAHIQSLGC